MNSLQQLVTRCYQLNRDCVPVPQKLLSGLADNTLVLNDLHIDHHEVDPLCRFLTSKTTMNCLEVVILNKSSAKTKRLRRLAAARAGTHSGLNLQGSKILKAVNIFISRSQALRYLEIDSVSLSLPLIQSLGNAMSERQESVTLGFQQVLIRNLHLGNEGLRALAPHLGKCLIQHLSLENCSLGDDTLPYLASIIKAHEAIQDKCYWNSTLRMYPDKVDRNAKNGNQPQRQYAYSDGVTNTGLLLLNLSRNKYTSVGSKGLCKLIQSNQWIAGINLSNNRIGFEGIEKIMECSQSLTNSNALLCLHLRGNNGCNAEVLEELSERAVQGMVNPVLAALPSHCATSLITWLRWQEDASPPAQARMSKANSNQRNGTVHKSSRSNQRESGGNFDRRDINMSSNSYKVDDFDQEEVLNFSDPDVESNEVFGNSTRNDVICDEELPSGQNYLLDTDVEGFIPPSPGKGIDGRPPSRNSIRPRSDDPEYTGGRMSATPSSASPTHSYLMSPAGRPKSARSSQNGNGRSINKKLNSGSDDMFKRSHSTRNAKGRSSKGAERYTNPYEVVTVASRNRSSQHSVNPRRGSRSSLEIISRSSTAAKGQRKPPFRPTSASAHLNSYEQNTKSHASYLKSTAMERDVTKSQDYLRRSHSATESSARGRARVESAKSVSRPRRRQSSIELTRARQQRKKRGSHTGRKREVISTTTAEILVEELNKSVLQELSKVVNSVSSEIQNMSLQMRSLTESVAESVSMINMSRDNTFATYNDAPKYSVNEGMNSAGLTNVDNHPINHRVDLSDMNQEQSEYFRLQQAMDEDANLSLLIEEGLRSKLLDVIENVMQAEA